MSSLCWGYIISCGPYVLKQSETIQTYVLNVEMYVHVNVLITLAISLYYNFDLTF